MNSQAEYFHEKYGMTKTHSAVVEAMATVAPCKALDLGCGQGRNALYLSLRGFDVTASDYILVAWERLPQLLRLKGLKYVPKFMI